MKRPIATLALIPLGFAMTAVGLEFILQLGALFVYMSGSEAPTEWTTDTGRILCVGDSNTYGLHLEDRVKESYPAQLEELWNRDSPEAKIEVLNLGYPGTNSSAVRRDLPRMLETFRPQVVVAMIGVNDGWTEPVEIQPETHQPGLLEFLRRNSRLYRGLFMLSRQLAPATLEVETIGLAVENFAEGHGVARYGNESFELGWNRVDRIVDSPWPSLSENLLALVEQAATARVKLVLMTYPGRFEFYQAANELTREVAVESGTPLVDLETVFTSLCPEKQCPEWLYPDGHPNSKGYGVVAESIMKQLAADGE